ncbi:MAG: hypothetical protein HY774_06940 [Acidobacteria bacterium]|nr:hypothetical protein [Acidobacteriota bacterium]
MVLLQSLLRVATLKKTYDLTAANYLDAFPKMVTYPQRVLQIHQLSGVIGHLQTTAIAVLE